MHLHKLLHECERSRYCVRVTATETAEPVPRLYTTAEVCERLQIGRTKFYTLRKQLEQAGRPVCPVRLGYKSLRWPESELAALIEAFTAQP